MIARPDLHTHSTASDGTLAPRQLVAQAAAAGVTLLALTDHDTTAGVAEAQAAAAEQGLVLVPGVEISVSRLGRTLHLVGLGVDPAHAELSAGLARLCDFRVWRAEEMGRRLAKHGVVDACAGASALAGGEVVGRTHFARLLIERGLARDMGDCFRRYLTSGKPGHVPGQWASLDEAVGWIRAAGGQAVLAHPARYGLTRTRMKCLLDEFQAAGGVGVEVISGSHSRDDALRFGRLCAEHSLLASVGSDYHGPDTHWLELGRLPPLPTGCQPIWRDWPCLRQAGFADDCAEAGRRARVGVA